LSNLYEGEYKITSPFGPRTLSNGDNRPHKGIDVVGLTSKNLIAITDGKIISSQIITDTSNITSEYGNYVIVDDLQGYTFRYCHLSKRLVIKGQSVKKGNLIGIEGATGYTDGGAHCHFEVRNYNGISIDPIIYFKILEEREKKTMVKTVDEALKVLEDKGIMNTIEYWKNASSVVKYLDTLLINMANAVK